MVKRLPLALLAAGLIGGCMPAAPTVATSASDPAATAVQIAAPAAAAPDQLAERLAGLDFDGFLEASFRELMLREPEYLVETGLDRIYGVSEIRLTDVSDEYARQTHDIERTVLEALRGYDREALIPEQQLSYDIYAWYLDDLLRAAEFPIQNYPVTFMINSRHAQTVLFFTETHPLANRQDAEAYVARLGLLGGKIDQLNEALGAREQAGFVPPKLVVEWTIPEIARIAGGPATVTPYYRTLESKIEGIAEMDGADRRELLSAAERALADGALPAYGRLWETLRRLQRSAPAENGLSQYGSGEDYYAHLLRHETSTGRSADEIHELGLHELERIHAEMDAQFAALGYPASSSVAQRYAQLASDSGFVSGGEAVRYIQGLLEAAEGRLATAFDIFPAAELAVVGGPGGNFYVPGSFDGSRPGAFYANTGSSQPRFSIASTAYHEGIPGHHLQLAIQQESDLPTMRKLAPFNAYIEGWALYAEQLASELGWYADDPYGDLGRLQLQAMRAARLVIDTGIHAEGWGFEQSVAFMIENTGLDRRVAEGEVGRYIAWPGQATSYMVGMLEIMALRQAAQERLGDEFDLIEFHHLLLANGSMPLEVLGGVMSEYMAGG